MLSTVVNFAILAAVASAACLPTTTTTSGSTTTTTPSSSGAVALHPNGNSNVCLDVQGNVQANGTPVQVYTCNGTGAQKWILHRGSGSVQLAGTNYCLDAGSSPASGVKMKIWQCYSGLAAQTWYWTDDNRIAVTGKGQCMDLPNGSTSNGNVVQTWACATGNTNQIWTATAAASRRSIEDRATCTKADLTPKGIKAGLAGGSSFDDFQNYVGWWYDWSGAPSGHSGSPVPVPMLWGNGHRGSIQSDSARFNQFTSTWSTSNVPAYVLGFNEPDCPGTDSSDLTVAQAASAWNQYIAPLGNAGALLISPAMCKQKDEDFLTPFQNAINTPFDVVAIHVYKNTLAGVKADIDYYYNKYGKPIWVTEFGCVNDVNGFVACSSQSVVNQFITDVVSLFESDSRIYAYAFCDVGNAWLMRSSSGSLSTTGQNYLAAVKKYA